MPLITTDDIIDVYQKLAQRGLGFVTSKLNPNSKSRTLSAFNNTAFTSSNWWIIQKIRERWNHKITGDTSVDYEKYTLAKYFSDTKNLKMLSIGSGTCSHEMKFATHAAFDHVICVDIAGNLLKIAEEKAREKEIEGMDFIEKDVYKLDYPENSFDVILFHSSLHHLRDIEQYLTLYIKKWLKPNGYILINEYVGPNRLQFNREQLNKINEGLQSIPERLRKRFKTGMIKRSYSGSGRLRMMLADPTECVESEQILPTLHTHFQIVEERPFGGNLLMNMLKDIAHHFTNNKDKEAQDLLNQLFKMEDDFLLTHKSDFIFGIYKNKKH